MLLRKLYPTAVNIAGDERTALAGWGNAQLIVDEPPGALERYLSEKAGRDPTDPPDTYLSPFRLQPLLWSDHLARGLPIELWPKVYYCWVGPRPRQPRPLCGARTRRGTPCGMQAVPGKRRCRLHGGCSTGPRTIEGRARVGEAARRELARRRAARAAEKAAGGQAG